MHCYTALLYCNLDPKHRDKLNASSACCMRLSHWSHLSPGAHPPVNESDQSPELLARPRVARRSGPVSVHMQHPMQHPMQRQVICIAGLTPWIVFVYTSVALYFNLEIVKDLAKFPVMLQWGVGWAGVGGDITSKIQSLMFLNQGLDLLNAVFATVVFIGSEFRGCWL